MRLVAVAERAEMKTGSLYYHFESREALVQAVLAEGISRTHHHVAERLAALPSTDPIDRIAAAITAHVEILHLISDFASASTRNVGQLPEELRIAHLDAQTAYGRLWRTLFDDAAKAGLIRSDLPLGATRMLVIGMLNWTTEWFGEGELSQAELAHAAVDLVIGGIAARRVASTASSVDH
jgi:TetR/AcrR family transcriptional regulator, cholesterol catabolism regulator